MLVDDEVFQTLERTKSASPPIATPNVVAMIALKRHALRQPARIDAEKDWSDIVGLVKAHQLSLDDPDFSATVLKHGGESAIQRMRTAILGGNQFSYGRRPEAASAAFPRSEGCGEALRAAHEMPALTRAALGAEGWRGCVSRDLASEEQDVS